MNSEPTSYHPAASHFARNLSGEKWDGMEEGETDANKTFNLMTFSPSTDKVTF